MLDGGHLPSVHLKKGDNDGEFGRLGGEDDVVGRQGIKPAHVTIVELVVAMPC